MMTIIPSKKAFIFYRIFVNSVYFLISLVALYFFISLVLSAFTEKNWIIISYNWIIMPIMFIVFILGSLFIYILRLIEYKKRFYIFESEKMVQKNGGLFYDNQNEIIIKNITHIRLILPFFEYKFFKTGNLIIDVAGSKKTEIFLESIENPEEFYKQTKQILQKNGFTLKKDKLLIEETPHKLGVIFETIKVVVSAFVFSLYILFNSDEDGGSLYGLIQGYISWTVILPVIVAGLAIWSIFVYLDLRRRMYKIYNDTIEYTEGFLSKNYAYIPVENLSDSQVKQTIIDKIFGLYDVLISAQGGGHEVLFKNLVRGQELSNVIDGLIEGTVNNAKIEKKKTILLTPKINKTKLLPTTNFLAEFRMNMGRSLFLPILSAVLLIIGSSVVSIVFAMFGELPIFSTALLSISIFVVIGIVICGVSIIKVKNTKFFVQNNSMQSVYKFLSTNEITFSNEKITGVVVNRNFVDKWFGTVSLTFLSIGSNSLLRFGNIKDENNIVTNVLAKFEMTDGNEMFKTGSKFSILESFKAWPHVFIIVFIFVFMPIVSIGGIFLFSNIIVANNLVSLVLLSISIFIVLILVVEYVYQREYFKRSNIIIYDNYVYREKGIFFKGFYYSPHSKIKNVTISRYAFSNFGSLRFDIAGESVTTQTNMKTLSYQSGAYGRSRAVSYKIEIDLIENIDMMDNIIDALLNNRKVNNAKEISAGRLPAAKVIFEAKQSLGNSIFVVLPIIIVVNLFPLLISLLWPPLFIITIILDVLIMAFIIMSIKVRRYIIEDYRVLIKSGIFYKDQKSVIFNKIDFISHEQGFVNKIFHNGNVIINTVGSSSAELTLINMKNYKEFYKIIEEKYKKI